MKHSYGPISHKLYMSSVQSVANYTHIHEAGSCMFLYMLL